jgi:hypothetical protein
VQVICTRINFGNYHSLFLPLALRIGKSDAVAQIKEFDTRGPMLKNATQQKKASLHFPEREFIENNHS